MTPPPRNLVDRSHHPDAYARRLDWAISSTSLKLDPGPQLLNPLSPVALPCCTREHKGQIICASIMAILVTRGPEQQEIVASLCTKLAVLNHELSGYLAQSVPHKRVFRSITDEVTSLDV